MWLMIITLQLLLYDEIISKECQEDFSISKQVDYNKVTSFKDGDYVIQSIQSVSNGGNCNEITIGGLLRIYAVKYAIESTNLNNNILHNVTLGWQIDDACLSLPIAMSRGIELSNLYRNAECNAKHKDKCTSLSVTKPAIAVVGAYFSFTTLPLASLFSLHNIPLISFGASTPLLSKTKDYPSFFRTIPPDTFLVEALIDIMLHYNWKYIFAVGSDDDYGKLGIRELKAKASNNGICVTGDVYIPFETSETIQKAKEIAAKIAKESRATVVVMFNYVLEMGEYILKEAEELKLKRIWLTSEAWNPEIFSVTDLPKNQLESIVTVSLQTGDTLHGFEQYIQETVRNSALCDGWLKLFIEQMFNCSINNISNDTLHGKFCPNNNCENCSVLINDVIYFILNENPSQINNLIDAVDSITQALNDTLIKSRYPYNTFLPAITPSNVTDAMKSVFFQTRRNSTFRFDSVGNPAFIQYSIEQIQWHIDHSDHEYVVIGTWTKQNAQKLDIKPTVWPEWTNGQPKSTCSVNCKPGEFIVVKSGCCWECRACAPNFFSTKVNSEKCMECPTGHHTVNNESCEKTPILYLSISDVIGITAVVFTIIGIILTVMAIIFFNFVKRSPFITASSAKIIMISFVLLLVTFAYIFSHIIDPTTAWCQFQCAYFHILISTYSGLLLVMNDSVTRYISKLVNSKEKAHITSIALFVMIQLVEIILITIWLCVDHTNTELINHGTSYLKQCNLDFTVLRILVFAFPCVILLVATIQSLSERNNPHSKQGRFVYFTCFLWCIISGAYIVTVNYVVGEYKALVTMLTIIGYGFVYLICMVYIPLFKAWAMPPVKQNSGILNIGFETAA